MNAPIPRSPAATPQPKAFRLAVSRGVQAQPEWLVVYGPPGIGKSTLAANAPRPLFLDLERGTSQLDVARVDGLDTWEDLLAAVQALRTEPHDFETLVVDTIDRAEWLVWSHLVSKARVDTIEKVGGGFGKGYIAAYEEFRRLVAGLQALRRERGMRTILLAHAALAKIPSASGDDYERWDLKLHKRAAGLFYEVFDAVLFAHYDTVVSKDGNRGRGYGNTRVLDTQETAAWAAKNRFGLGARMPLSWDELAAGIASGNSPALLTSTIRGRLARVKDPSMVARAEKALIEHATNVPKLVEINNWLAANMAPEPAAQPSTDPQPQQPQE